MFLFLACHAYPNIYVPWLHFHIVNMLRHGTRMFKKITKVMDVFTQIFKTAS